METDNQVEGKRARVTGRVAPGAVGEVAVPIRGGVETFNAYPYDGKETIEIGELVMVMECLSPRSVAVTAFTY
jgi:hypothetical protein